MSNFALTFLSIAVGISFVFFGTLKLAPVFSEDFYRSVRQSFVKSYTPFPLSQWTHWNPSPHSVRRMYGSTEVTFGLLLMVGSTLVQDISTMVLLVLMLFHLMSLWISAGDFRDASNSIVCALLLTCRLVIRAQTAQSSANSKCEQALPLELRQRIAHLRKELIEMKQATDQRLANDKGSTKGVHLKSN